VIIAYVLKVFFITLWDSYGDRNFMRKTWRRRQCFTLIEMVVIMIIMAVFAAIAAPKLNGFYQNARYDSAIRQIKSLIESAQLQSSLGDNEYRVVIPSGWREFRLETRKRPAVTNPEEAVEYVKNVESGVMKKAEFVLADNEFSMAVLPDDIEIISISISGQPQSVKDNVTVKFKALQQPDIVDFVFKKSDGSYRGLRLEAGGGGVHDLPVIKF